MRLAPTATPVTSSLPAASALIPHTLGTLALALSAVGLVSHHYGLLPAPSLAALTYSFADLLSNGLFSHAELPVAPAAASIPANVSREAGSGAQPSTGSGGTLLFVYGTLKRGFHWHSKFLSFARFVGHGTTLHPIPLVVGQSGVPYLLAAPQVQDSPADGQAAGPYQRVRGEVYEVDSVSMLGLDQYEGLGKGYYCRMQVPVCMERELVPRPAEQHPSSGTASAPPAVDTLVCQVYALQQPSADLLVRPTIAEYTLALHRTHYNAIRHIRVKQERYLGIQGASSRS